MMKAIKNFMNKPITWGDSFKWSGIFLGLYSLQSGSAMSDREKGTRWRRYCTE